MIFPTNQGKEINRLQYKTILTAVSTHPKDDQILMLGANNEIIAWDVRTNNCSKTYKYKTAIGQVIKLRVIKNYISFLFMFSKTQDILFLNENEFVSCGDIVCKESGENAILVWDYKSTAYISNQIFHVKSFKIK